MNPKHQWFHEARFGMFVHWGLYAIPARGEWVMEQERMPRETYARFADEFCPSRFDADAWAGLARKAGARYMVVTARHHDGFCLFDSRVSDFTSVKRAVRRDFIAEYTEACRRHGLKVGIYYSLLDWRFPGSFEGPVRNPDSCAAMVRQAHDQVRELMTHYGRVDYLFYDGEWIPGLEWRRSPHGLNLQSDSPELAEFWRSGELNAMARQLQPDIIINNRSGTTEDLDTPEQHVTASAGSRLWEANMTIGDSWGFAADDPIMKSPTHLIRALVSAAAGAGNFLLNVGPGPDGSIREEFVERLTVIGEWLARNGESIYGSERAPVMMCNTVPLRFAQSVFGNTTVKANHAYVHLYGWPRKELVLVGIANEVRSARFLANGANVPFEKTRDGKLYLRNLPPSPLDRYDTVVKLELDGPPRLFSYEGTPL